MAFMDCRDSEGKLLFRFDPDADCVEVLKRVRKGEKERVVVPLSVYRERVITKVVYDHK